MPTSGSSRACHSARPLPGRARCSLVVTNEKGASRVSAGSFASCKGEGGITLGPGASGRREPCRGAMASTKIACQSWNERPRADADSQERPLVAQLVSFGCNSLQSVHFTHHLKLRPAYNTHLSNPGEVGRNTLCRSTPLSCC